jgi:hypothetical protein
MLNNRWIYLSANESTPYHPSILSHNCAESEHPSERYATTITYRRCIAITTDVGGAGAGKGGGVGRGAGTGAGAGAGAGEGAGEGAGGCADGTGDRGAGSGGGLVGVVAAAGTLGTLGAMGAGALGALGAMALGAAAVTVGATGGVAKAVTAAAVETAQARAQARSKAQAWARAKALVQALVQARAQARALEAEARARARPLMLEPMTKTFTYQDVLADPKLKKIIYSIKPDHRYSLAGLLRRCSQEYWWLIQIVTPITRLPTELLHQIFLVVIDETSHSPLVLMQVCKHWHAIVTTIWGSLNLGTRTPKDAVITEVRKKSMAFGCIR